jgi:hypothetical protein
MFASAHVGQKQWAKPFHSLYLIRRPNSFVIEEESRTQYPGISYFTNHAGSTQNSTGVAPHF